MKARLRNRILLLISLPLVAQALVTGLLLVDSLNRVPLEAVTVVMEKKLQANVRAFRTMAERSYGTLSLGQVPRRGAGQAAPDMSGALLDKNGYPLEIYPVELFATDFDNDATILVKDGDRFVRVLTSLRDAEGNRLNGTDLTLDPGLRQTLLGGKAGASGLVREGGAEHLSAFEPIYDADNQAIGLYAASAPLSAFSQFVEQAARQRILVLAVGVVLFLLVLLVAVLPLLARSLRPLEGMVGMLAGLAAGEGDLTGRLSAGGRDEIAQLAGHFNAFMGKLGGLVGSVKLGMGEIEDTSRELDQVIGDTETRSTEIGAIQGRLSLARGTYRNTLDGMVGRVGGISGRMEELRGRLDDESAAIGSASAAVTEMVASVEAITGHVSGIAAQNSQLHDSTGQGAASFDRVAKTVAEVARRSESLETANHLIAAVAEQTNILAMNAAIEAAHAGMAGKGFAVVAAEIKRLAETTGVQSDSISRELAAVREAIQATEAASREAAVQMGRIRSLAETVAGLQAQVHASLAEQQAGSHQVLEALEAITRVAAEAEAVYGLVAGDTGLILEQSAELDQLDRDMAGRLDELANRNADIAALAGRARGASGRNRTSVEAVMRPVGRFRT